MKAKKETKQQEVNRLQTEHDTYFFLIKGIDEAYKNCTKSEKEFVDNNWKDICVRLIEEFNNLKLK